MKNAIIINGTTYELVPSDTDMDVCYTCNTCDLRAKCNPEYSICIYVHNAGPEDHYIKRQKGGDE